MIVLSSDPLLPDNIDTLQEHKEHIKKEPVMFLEHCNVPKEDKFTRAILKCAGVTSWTNLIPSVQFTEMSLTSCGMHPSLASFLLTEAMDQVNGLTEEIIELQDEEEDPKFMSTPPVPVSPEF
ncbi:uncharacterized protein MELLADRAFT_51317 [Melampsora larici-populina 98AG31]|uniref:Uncharacterized protein n=1 Tax=Melampsora larici-populina (strain 98AG31 / pathotype 3-4-7) TaxID=747676 RepID=F4R407_MELLP|nr:uncharacterized protein MELLADRAFT_51317 [Melampsora larici-populina 98AG31]EGG12716.1 hypothetical protein MELLADRAFT_51317 [Melampsora larici-populina 98AG31]